MQHPINQSTPAKLGVHFQTAGLVRLSQILAPSGRSLYRAVLGGPG
jgi:hypothetical protein